MNAHTVTADRAPGTNPPVRRDELSGAVAFIDAQLEALRSAVFGLTEEQARERPCRSELSLGGLLEHAMYSMEENLDWLADPDYQRVFDRAGYEKFANSFVVGSETTVAQTIGRFDDLRPRFLAALSAADADSDRLEPIAPWDGRMEPSPIKLRYRLLHLVEEFARHAGHADILREQIDGESVPGLEKSLHGQPSNDFFTAFEAKPGTLLA